MVGKASGICYKKSMMSQSMDSQVDMTCLFSEVSDETRNEEQMIRHSGKDYPQNKEGNQG